VTDQRLVKIPFDRLAEAVRSEIVKASSDAALLEQLIVPLIQQQRLWDHYPALLHGLWAAVWSSFYMTLSRLFEFKNDWRLASLANLLRRLEEGQRPAMPLPDRCRDARIGFLSRVQERLSAIKQVERELAILRSGYLAHRDLTKPADHEKAQGDMAQLKDLLLLAQTVMSDYLLAFRDEGQAYEPTNYPREPEQFLKWCRLDNYAVHHAAWVQAEHDAQLKRLELRLE